jgi:hypothetical protein
MDVIKLPSVSLFRDEDVQGFVKTQLEREDLQVYYYWTI